MVCAAASLATRNAPARRVVLVICTVVGWGVGTWRTKLSRGFIRENCGNNTGTGSAVLIAVTLAAASLVLMALWHAARLVNPRR
jgi:hypothetical protein